MVALLDELESRGLVERRRDPDDRRAYALHLTDRGREALRRGRRVAGRMQRQMLVGLDAAEQAELLRLLGKVASAMEERDAAVDGGPGRGSRPRAPIR
jgi:DNA-binding MarR family transcriptional regulator